MLRPGGTGARPGMVKPGGPGTLGREAITAQELGLVGSGNTAIARNFFNITVQSAVPVGASLHVGIVFTNGTSGGFTASDSKGNTYTDQTAGQRSGNAWAGHIRTKVTSALSAGDIVTVTFDSNFGQCAASLRSWANVGELVGPGIPFSGTFNATTQPIDVPNVKNGVTFGAELASTGLSDGGNWQPINPKTAYVQVPAGSFNPKLYSTWTKGAHTTIGSTTPGVSYVRSSRYVSYAPSLQWSGLPEPTWPQQPKIQGRLSHREPPRALHLGFAAAPYAVNTNPTAPTHAIPVTKAVSAGATLFVGVGHQSNTGPLTAVSDSKGNTYDSLTDVARGGTLRAAQMIGRITTPLQAGDTITVTMTGSSNASGYYVFVRAFANLGPLVEQRGYGGSTAAVEQSVSLSVPDRGAIVAIERAQITTGVQPTYSNLDPTTLGADEVSVGSSSVAFSQYATVRRGRVVKIGGASDPAFTRSIVSSVFSPSATWSGTPEPTWASPEAASVTPLSKPPRSYFAGGGNVGVPDSSRRIGFTVTTRIPAGDRAIVYVTPVSYLAGGIDIQNIEDPRGNTWSADGKLAGNFGGSGNQGIVWSSRVTTALQPGDVLNAYTTSGTSGGRKAAMLLGASGLDNGPATLVKLTTGSSSYITADFSDAPRRSLLLVFENRLTADVPWATRHGRKHGPVQMTVSGSSIAVPKIADGDDALGIGLTGYTNRSLLGIAYAPAPPAPDTVPYTHMMPPLAGTLSEVSSLGSVFDFAALGAVIEASAAGSTTDYGSAGVVLVDALTGEELWADQNGNIYSISQSGGNV